MSRPTYVAFVDLQRGATLVRGEGARALLRLLGFTPRWSVAARGWVVRDTEVCHDVQADANYHHGYAVISYRRPT